MIRRPPGTVPSAVPPENTTWGRVSRSNRVAPVIGSVLCRETFGSPAPALTYSGVVQLRPPSAEAISLIVFGLKLVIVPAPVSSPAGAALLVFQRTYTRPALGSVWVTPVSGSVNDGRLVSIAMAGLKAGLASAAVWPNHW